MNYFLHIVILLEIYIILALSLNMKVGFTGLLSIAQAIFYGIGAYVTAIFMVELGSPFLLAIVISIVVSVFFSLFIAFIASRLRDLYFALATMAFQIILYAIIYNWTSLTNGPYGIAGIPQPEILGVAFDNLSSFALLGFVFMVLTILFLLWFQKTPFSRLLESTRDDELAVIAMGKNPKYYKRFSVCISGALAAIAGSLYATYVTYIDPSSFTIDESILIMSIVIIGGTGNIWGPVSGALFYILLPEVLKFIDIPDSIAASLRMIIYGFVLILIIRIKPDGFFGKYVFK
ncbi:MAG: branched-chain amino acid ABC transporter permease [Bacteroidales bacterium]|nr:branched-chain amino acid ABC transporter permease [Bacteroidales bacterium]